MNAKKFSYPYLSRGRVNQKTRTRDALIAVAADLIRQGRSFSVGEVADLAKVGRTTAYRYFPTQEQLLAHAALWKISLLEHHEFEQIFDKNQTLPEKLDALVLASDKSTRDHEEEYRAMLRTSIERRPEDRDEFPARTGFRHRLLRDSLSDLEKPLGEELFERLIAAISLTLGIEALIVLHDVCLLPPERAAEIKRWAARMLLDGALFEAKENVALRKNKASHTLAANEHKAGIRSKGPLKSGSYGRKLR